jgi:hypothetical protein
VLRRDVAREPFPLAPVQRQLRARLPSACAAGGGCCRASVRARMPRALRVASALLP